MNGNIDVSKLDLAILNLINVSELFPLWNEPFTVATAGIYEGDHPGILVVIDDDICEVRVVKSLGFLPQSIVGVHGGLVGAASMVAGAVMAMARARVVRWLAWLLRSGIALLAVALARVERANLVLIV